MCFQLKVMFVAAYVAFSAVAMLHLRERARQLCVHSHVCSLFMFDAQLVCAGHTLCRHGGNYRWRYRLINLPPLFWRTCARECAYARTKILLSFTHTHTHAARVTLCCILLGQKIKNKTTLKKTRNSSQFFAYRPSCLAIRLFCYVFSLLTDKWACFCRYSDNATATQIEMGSII